MSSRQVPRYRSFVIQRFGQASNSPATTPCHTLDTAAQHSTYPGPGTYHPAEEVRRLLQKIDDWAEGSSPGQTNPSPPEPNRTWGFYVFLTAYDTATLEDLDVAMKTWVRIQDRALDWAPTLDIYRDEARTRFSLDVVVDARELENASDIRVRANFQALVRGLGWDDSEGRGNGWPVTAKRNVALVLGSQEVHTLARLELRDEEKGVEEFKRLEKIKVKAIDIHYNPDDYQDDDDSCESEGGWRGIGFISINRLLPAYHDITVGANSGAVEDYFSGS